MLCFFRRLKPVFSFLYAVFKEKSAMFSITLVSLNCCSKSEVSSCLSVKVAFCFKSRSFSVLICHAQGTGPVRNNHQVLKRVDRPTRLPCTWSGFCCLCHNVALLSTYLNGRLF